MPAIINKMTFLGMPPAALLALKAPARGKADPPETRKQVMTRVCQECEALFLSQLLKQLRHCLLSGELGHRSPRTEHYWSLFDQELARHLAGSGGIGLGRRLYEQLQREHLSSPSLSLGERKP